MRRRQRYRTTGAILSGGFSALIDIGLQWWEHHERNERLTWKSFDGQRCLCVAGGGAIIGCGLGDLYYQYRCEVEKAQPFNQNEYLLKVLRKAKLGSDPRLVRKAVKYRSILKEWIEDEFEGMLAAPPEDSGSFYKRTALAADFDLDIIVPFARQAYSSLEEMFSDFFEAVDGEFGSNATVIKQTRAVGLCFQDGPDEIYIDLIPGREISDYIKDGNLNLYVRPDYFWQDGTSFKTNVHIQRSIPIYQRHCRSVIILLKLYRLQYVPELPVIHIEAAAAHAQGSCIASKLLNTMEILSDLLVQHGLTDKANSNNNLNDKVPSSTRESISRLLRRDIERISGAPRYWKEIFEI